MNGKQLKNSILQWAIQGKLVPQDPNDEPASVLLERIREEKARLVKEGKIKKDKNESIIFRGDDNSYYEKFLATGEVKCIDDEIPFEIPEGWEWCRLKTISIIQEGPGIRSFQYTTKGVQLLTVTNILEGAVDLQKSQKYISNEEYTNKYLHFQLNKGDIVCACSGGSWGKSAIFDLDNKQIILNTSTLRLRFYGDLGCNGFLYHLTKSSFFKLQLAEQLSGMQPNFGYAHYSKILIPLPPIQEQMRIKSKINELLPPLSKYTHAQDKLDRLNASIKPSLKKAVLQEAIQGKLVPQDPNDEPASVLLERIREEKAKLFKEGKLKKKDLVDSVIFKGEDNKYFEKIGKEIICIDDDIPFDIPISWEWVRLGNLFQHNTGKALNGSNQKGTLYEYITTSNLYWNQFVLDKLRQMLFTNEELEKCTVRKGDLLICEGGDIGRCAIWNYDYDIRIQNHIHRLRAFTPVCTSFFYYTMYLYKHIGLIGGKGIGIQGLSSNALHKLLLPLPPMNEQQRIVNKIESAIASIMSR